MENTPNQSTLENKLVEAMLAEQKTSRRWKNARFIVWVLLIVIAGYFLFGSDTSSAKKNGNGGESYVALIRLSGIIMPSSDFSAKNIIPELTRAFRDKEAKGVVLLINSPGGSPVQASMIHDKIVQLKEKYHKEVIVVGEDTLASGAYLVSTAADKIFVSKDTVTGSIGVIMEGFGFNDIMKKLGISRRVFTAGAHKDRLDPFETLNPQDEAKIHGILNAVHQDFIDDVKKGRGNRLKGDPKKLFSGDFWTGTQAVQLGLADGTANVWEAVQKTFGTTRYHDYSPHPNFWQSVVRDVSSELHLKFINHTKVQEII